VFLTTIQHKAKTMTENTNYFNENLSKYLKEHGILEQATEYARVNATRFKNSIGYKSGKKSLWWAFSWTYTHEGFGYWANHHELFLMNERIGLHDSL
jgi:hypothetical protein